MDDMYQYAASAVNSNNTRATSNVNEEEDVIIKAFNNIGWGKKWSSLVDTVKKQGEAFVEGTKKDLQEFAQVLTEDDPADSEVTNINNEGEASTTTRSTTDEGHSSLNIIRDNLSKINTVNLNSLRDGLTHALSQGLPQQLSSVRLPENMDLAQLKEGLTNGTRSVEQYLEQFGTDVVATLKNTITVLAPEEEEEQEEEGDSNSKPRIYASRKEGLIAKMQNNESTYLNEPELKDDQETKVYDTFKSGFNIEEYTDEIAQLLNDYPNLRETMDKLVPIQVSYTLFWSRYFYCAWKIDQDEQKRQLIVKGVDEEDFKWDSDEEDNKDPNLVPSSSTTTITNKNIIASERPSTSNSDDTDDFSNISEPIESPTLNTSQTTEDEWIKPSKADNANAANDSDSDSDWE